MKRTPGRLIGGIAVGLVSFLLLHSAFGQEDVDKAIHQTVLKNLKAAQAEDLTAMMKTIHSQSPVYQSTKEKTRLVFRDFQLKYNLLSYRFIGTDGEYAVARIKRRVTKVSGPALRPNEVDTMQVFLREKGEWKLWHEVFLEIRYLAKPDKPK